MKIEGANFEVKGVSKETEVEVMETSSDAVVHKKKHCKFGSLTHSLITYKQCKMNNRTKNEVFYQEMMITLMCSPLPNEEWRTKYKEDFLLRSCK